MNLLILHIVIILIVAVIFAFILWKYLEYKHNTARLQHHIDILTENSNGIYQKIANVQELTSIIKTMPVGVKIYNSDGKLICSNLRDREIFGVPDTVDLMQFTVFTSPVLPKTLVNSFKSQLPFKDTIAFDFSKLPSNYCSQFKHITKWIIMSGYPIMDITGTKLEKYIVTSEDITETVRQKHNNKDLLNSLNYIADATNISAWCFDIGRQMVYDLNGNTFSSNNLSLNDFTSRIHADDTVILTDAIAQLTDGSIKQIKIGLRFMDADTDYYKHIRCTLKAINDADGKTVKIIALHYDATENTKLHEKITSLESSVVEKDKRIREISNNLSITLDSDNLKLFKFDLVTGQIMNLFESDIKFNNLTVQGIYSRTNKDTAELLEKYRQMFCDGSMKSATFVYPYISGNRKLYFHVSLRAVNGADGKPSYLIGTIRDNTEEHLIQNQMRFNSLRTRMVLEASGDEYWEYYANLSLLKKISSENEIERIETFDDFIGSINAQDMTTEFRRAINAIKSRTNKTFILDLRMKHIFGNNHTGDWRHFSISMVPAELDSNGLVTIYACIKRDVTNEVHIREEIAQKNVQTELALGAGHIIPFTIDSKSDTVQLPFNNSIATHIFGSYPPTISLNKFIHYVSGNNDYASLSEVIEKLKNGVQMQCQKESAIIDKNNSKTFIELYFIGTNYSKQGLPAKIVGLIQDVTEQKLLLANLEKAREQAEESNKLKSAFLANMSHEIRTPLNAIVGFSALLVESDDTNERKEYSSIIETNNELLLTLINDILDLSKIEAGMMVLKPQTFDLADTFNKSGRAMQQKCQKKNPNVELEVESPYKSCIVTLDPNRLTQIWTNYATNSIKYTPSGKIRMGYKYADGKIYIYVKDTGIGIAKDKQNLVFRRFNKLDDFAQGTGLGLSIVKAIVNQCGGTVGFESEEGKGSTFYAYIPCDAKIEEF